MTGPLAPAVLAAAAVVAASGPRARSGDRLGRLWRRRAGRVRAGRGDALAGGVVAALRRVVGRRRALEQERERAVEACAALAGELRAGRPADVALHAAAEVAVGPTGAALRAGAAALAVGADVSARLTAGASASACPALLRGLAACWTVCSATGSGLAAAVEQLEAAERDTQERRRAVAAELAGPAATARLLAALPVLGVALAASLGASPVRFLVTTPLGLACLVAGVGLDLAGVVWTRRLVTRAVGGGAG